MKIEKHSIHLWQADLATLSPHEGAYFKLLSPDEAQRAERFHFPKDKKKFTLARGLLRSVLSRYVDIPPEDIMFEYGPRGKPYLKDNREIQFNISHSDELVVLGLILHDEVGVDIEKMSDHYKEGVAKRFFSESEFAELKKLSEKEQITAFYRLWAAKEALIKAVGEGLYVPLGNFTVAFDQNPQQIELIHDEKKSKFFLETFQPHSDYQGAFATQQEIKQKMFFKPQDLM